MIQERFQTKISRRYGIDLYPAYIFAGDLSRAARFSQRPETDVETRILVRRQ